MSDRPTITTLPAGGRYDVSTLNSNFTAVRNQFDELVGRNGTGGSNNSASGNLDMNGNSLLNVGDVLNTSGAGIISSVDYAEEWANKAEDSLVTVAAGGDGVDDYSSKHFSIKAAASSTAATSSQSAAASSATSAATSATAAATSATASATSATASATSATASATSATASATSATSSATSATTATNAAAAVAKLYDFDSSTTMADPGAGELRLNDGTVGSVTAIAFSNRSNDSGNPDISDYIATWDDSTNTIKGYLSITKGGTPATFAIYSVSAVADNTAWLQVTVAHIASNGSWTAADDMYIDFIRSGDAGLTGATGPVGIGLALALGG
jgi:hypothetical protein